MSFMVWFEIALGFFVWLLALVFFAMYRYHSSRAQAAEADLKRSMHIEESESCFGHTWAAVVGGAILFLIAGGIYSLDRWYFVS